MTEKRFILKSDYDWWGVVDTTGKIKGEYNECFSTDAVVDLLNTLHEKNEQLNSLNQSLRSELKFDEKMYKTFKEVIDEADDLIKSHLSKHYQRKWKNFCESRGIDI